MEIIILHDWWIFEVVFRVRSNDYSSIYYKLHYEWKKINICLYRFFFFCSRVNRRSVFVVVEKSIPVPVIPASLFQTNQLRTTQNVRGTGSRFLQDEVVGPRKSRIPENIYFFFEFRAGCEFVRHMVAINY